MKECTLTFKPLMTCQLCSVNHSLTSVQSFKAHSRATRDKATQVDRINVGQKKSTKDSLLRQESFSVHLLLSGKVRLQLYKNPPKRERKSGKDLENCHGETRVMCWGHPQFSIQNGHQNRRHYHVNCSSINFVNKQLWHIIF